MKYYSDYQKVMKIMGNGCSEYRAREIIRKSREKSEEMGIRTFKESVYNGAINKHLGIDLFDVPKQK